MPIICTRAAASTRFNGHLGGTINGQVHSYLQARLAQSFTTPGRYTWIVPPGVTSITVMAIGGGGAGGSVPFNATVSVANGGGGAGYAYMYNYPVTPGDGYNVQVGCGAGTTERNGTVYWDAQDNGITYDKAGYSVWGRGGIASWFGNANVCRGGGGMSGNGATISGTYLFTGNAYGGYYTLGSGISGGGMYGGMGGNVWTTSSSITKIGGGGGAGSASSTTDITGMGSFDGQSQGAGTSGGGAGGGAGLWNGNSSGTGALSKVMPGGDWGYGFMYDYGVWPSMQPATGAASANTTAFIVRRFTATYSGTFYHKAAADNRAYMYIDNVLVASPSENFRTEPSFVAVTLTAGVHVVKVFAINDAQPAGVAFNIYNSSYSLLWSLVSVAGGSNVLSGYYGLTPGGQGGGVGFLGITPDSGGLGSGGLDARNGMDTSGTGFLPYGGTIYDGVSSLYTRTSGYWGTFQNTYAVWPTPFDDAYNYIIYREYNAPAAGTHYVRVTADNHANVFINNSFITSADDTFSSTPSPITVTLNKGINVIKLRVKNDENVCGIAMTISNAAGYVVWDTVSSKDSIPTGTYYTTGGGDGGSGGTAGLGGKAGYNPTYPSLTNNGTYGGGGGGHLGIGAHGAVRIMWEPGSAYPSTNTSSYFGI